MFLEDFKFDKLIYIYNGNFSSGILITCISLSFKRSIVLNMAVTYYVTKYFFQIAGFACFMRRKKNLEAKQKNKLSIAKRLNENEEETTSFNC